MSTLDFDPKDALQIPEELIQEAGWSSPMKLDLIRDGNSIKIVPTAMLEAVADDPNLTVSQRLMMIPHIRTGRRTDDILAESRSEI